ARGPHVVFRDEPAGILPDRLRPLDAGAPEGRTADLLQHQVQRDREGPDRAFAEPVVGDVAQPEPPARPDIEMPDRAALERHAARSQRALAGQRLGKLLLAIAVDAGDAKNLARGKIEGDVLHRDTAGP